MMLTLNFLIADGQMTAAEKYGIIRGTAELNQSRYFGNTLHFKCKSESVLLWGNLNFKSTENKRL